MMGIGRQGASARASCSRSPAASLIAGIPGALFAVPLAAFVNVLIVYISGGIVEGRCRTARDGVRSPLWRTVPQRPGYQRGE